MGSRARQCFPRGGERFQCRGNAGQWMGMDLHAIRPVPRIRAVSLLSRIFRRFLRRQALRHERRVGAHRRMHAPAYISQLVPGSLPICLRRIPLREFLNEECPMLVHAIPANLSYEFAADVRDGLRRNGQKELPSKYLYDDVGSALFEVISHLPEYGLTRADERLLRRYAQEIADRVDGCVAVTELGSGTGRKTRWILEAFCRRQRTSYYPVEIS